MKVDFIVTIKHPDDSEPMFMTREQAKSVYEQLHAEFGGVAKDSFMDRLTVMPRPSLGSLPPEQRVHDVVETGPTLQDDIAFAEIAKHVVESQEKVDDATEAAPIFDEAKFLAGSPQEKARQTDEDQHEWPLGDDASHLQEPPPLIHDISPKDVTDGAAPTSEPRVVAEISMTLDDVRSEWAEVQEDYSDLKEWEQVNRFCIRNKLSAAQGRALLAEAGIELAAPRLRKASKVDRAVEAAPEAPQQEPIVKAPPSLLDRFPDPLTGLDASDVLSLAFDILEHDRPQISSLCTAKAGVDAVMAFKRKLGDLKAEFMELPPFERRQLKMDLRTKWFGSGKGDAK